MPLYITNTALMSAQRYFNNASAALDTTYKRLASGLRINSAKDDPAGLMISNRMTSEINGLKQGSRNANDGIALAQTMEAALDETKTMLQRIRTLSIQAATGSITPDDRESLNREVQQLCEEITRISCRTTYGGAKMLCGVENAKGAVSLINDKGAIVIHVGPNANDTVAIGGFEQGFSLSGIAGMVGALGNPGMSTDGQGRFCLSTAESAEAVLSCIDKFISKVSEQQSYLGAVQNRLESTIRLNDVMHNNLSDARSRIRDTDYAEETANLAQQTIQQQMALAMMKRIGQSKNLILQLLG